jgi:hypothetical protein
VTFDKIGAMAGWSLGIVTPPADATNKRIIKVLPADIPAGGAAPATVQVRLQANANATSTGQARLTIQKVGSTVPRTVTFDVQKTGA